MRRSSRTSSGTRSRWISHTLYSAGAIAAPPCLRSMREAVAGDWAVVSGESDLVAAKAVPGVFIANGPEFERSPREFVSATREVREILGPAKVVAVTGLATPSNLSVLAYAGIDVVDSSRMRLDSARGLFHTADGTVPLAEADRDACGCPACAAGERLGNPPVAGVLSAPPIPPPKAVFAEPQPPPFPRRNRGECESHGRSRGHRHIAPRPDSARAGAVLPGGCIRHSGDWRLEPRRGRDGHRGSPGVSRGEPVRNGRRPPRRGSANREGSRARRDPDFEGTAHLGRITCLVDADAEPRHGVGTSGPERPSFLRGDVERRPLPVWRGGPRAGARRLLPRPHAGCTADSRRNAGRDAHGTRDAVSDPSRRRDPFPGGRVLGRDRGLPPEREHLRGGGRRRRPGDPTGG